MRVSTDGTKKSFVFAVSAAILQQKQSIITNIEVDGENKTKGFVLPKLDSNGTWEQLQSRARVEAEKIYTGYFTNKLLKSKEPK